MRRLLSELCNGTVNRRVVRFARDQQATTAVEFAFVAPILIAILIATLQISVIFFAQAYLATVADATARQVLTNQQLCNSQGTQCKTIGLDAQQFKTTLCGNVTAMFVNCQTNMVVSLQAAPTTQAGIAAALPKFDAAGNLIGTPPINSVGANAKALLIIMYQWPTISGPLGAYFGTLANGKYLLTATEVFQTEPCTTANGC